MRIGVSGHQQFESGLGVAWIESEIKAQLTKYPENTTGISCLAIGADQIFASAILEVGFELEEVTPCHNYVSTFKNEIDRANFENLSSLAKRHHRLHYPQPNEEAFLRAGQFVVEISDFMFFIWNGKVGSVGGTEAIVRYARQRSVPFLHFNPNTQIIKRC
jgi:hypothetical protein